MSRSPAPGSPPHSTAPRTTCQATRKAMTDPVPVELIFASGQSFDDPDGVEAGEAIRNWSPALAYLFDQPGMRHVPRQCWIEGWHPSGPNPAVGDIPDQFKDRLFSLLQWAEENKEVDCCPSATDIKINGCSVLPREWVRVHIDAEFGIPENVPRPPGTICFYPCRGSCVITQQFDLAEAVRDLANAVLLEMTKPDGLYELRWLRHGDPSAEWSPLSPARWRLLRFIELNTSEIDIDGQRMKVRVFRRWPTETKVNDAAVVRKRAAYREALANFMAPKDLRVMLRAGAAAVAAEFIEACNQQKPRWLLPQARAIEAQVQKILDRRSQSARIAPAVQRQQRTPTTPNRK